MKYSNEYRNALRARISDYLRLAAGVENPRRAFRCLHPDHEDTHPSMSLDPSTNYVKCFSCGASGDIFQVAEWLGKGNAFPEQVQAVADALGMPIEDEASSPTGHAPIAARATSQPPKAEPADLPDLFPRALDAYFRLFESEGAHALDYLHRRGFTDEEVARGGFGWAHHPSGVMPSFNNAPGHDAGYLTLPFPDDAWEVRYLVARPLPPARAKEYKPAGIPAPFYREYLLTEAERVAVVEGVFDAVAFEALSGIPAVALCGTSNALRFVGLLEGLPSSDRPRKLVLALDADDSGEKASLAIADACKRLRIQYQVFPMPAGCNDPADTLAKVREGGEAA